jgi:hypothetical protein
MEEDSDSLMKLEDVLDSAGTLLKLTQRGNYDAFRPPGRVFSPARPRSKKFQLQPSHFNLTHLLIISRTYLPASNQNIQPCPLTKEK